MTEFYQTVMGKRFYEGQLPRLISAMERIADVLEEQMKPTIVCSDVPTEPSPGKKLKPSSVSKEEYQGKVQKWKTEFEDMNGHSFREAYPIVDLKVELHKAALWLFTNPSKRKKNFDRFFNNWCSRIQERGIQASGNTQAPLEDL